ncbi:Proteasome subunit alpha type-3 [Ancistrocladus abbreviatus]
MVGVTPTSSLSSAQHFYAIAPNPSPSSSSSSSSSTTTPLTFHQIIQSPTRRPISRRIGLHYSSNHSSGGRRKVFSIKAYIENPNSLSGFASKVIGSLPVVGLIARIISDEGGVGGDIIDFAEFRRRVGKKCTLSDSRAFYEFRDRRGRAGDPLYVLLCCWLAAVGAGLLKSEEILEGVARLRLSNDIEFEEQNFLARMNEARERRAKSRAAAPVIPMETRAAKALEAIYVCCFGEDPVEEEDERLLNIMLSAVFPTVGQAKIEAMIKEKAKEVAEGFQLEKFPVKPLSKEAIELQMKDLQFLKQNSAELLERKNES